MNYIQQLATLHQVAGELTNTLVYSLCFGRSLYQRCQLIYHTLTILVTIVARGV